MKKVLALTITVTTLIALSACQQKPAETPIETTTDQTKKSIEIVTPQANQTVTSPIEITGTATLWFFEGEFPILLQDKDGNIIAETQATSLSDWMTEDPVPFSASLEFEEQQAGTSGKIIFQKANPSGMPEHDERYELNINF